MKPRTTLKKYIARKTRKYRTIPLDNEHILLKRNTHLLNRKKGIARCMPLLSPIYDNTQNIKAGDKLLLTMGKDEGKRIPYFLEYYRQLGIDHFFFIDNDSIEPMADSLSGMPDVSLWHTKDSYSGSNYGVDWMNVINGHYAPGHWTLTVDLDEFLVFPYMEDRSFSELCLHLDNMEQASMFCPLIDMYPNGPISDAVVPPGDNPLNYADHFDVVGYHSERGIFDDVWIRGGPRCRVFNHGDVQKSPSINKTPLMKWNDDTLYLVSTHTAYPFEYNQPHNNGISSVTGALLHFKFTSDMTKKAEYAVKHKNHYKESREYIEYLKTLERDEHLNLTSPVSAKYINSHSLIDAKLMNTALWGFQHNPR